MLGKNFTKNEEYINAPREEVWRFLSTTEGWKSFLCDIASNSNGTSIINLGDNLEFVIGELTIQSQCKEFIKNELVCFDEKYIALFPNGDNWIYYLKTSFKLESLEQNITKVTVVSSGYKSNEMMQWVKECGEMGWRQTLINLKSVIELGLDLRNEIFNYPRLGVFNYTANPQQLNRNSLNGLKGNYLAKVYNNSPAFKAGLKDGDIITHINGHEVGSYYDFVRVLSKHSVKKDNLIIRYVRMGRHGETCANLTYDERFTGMIDPTETPLEKVAKERELNDKV
ncbi:PDZ domain-containing protein [Cytobacillus firmus]|uniref:PDZ domain-containing protein n=1 Tax=Cytobacillus firmus TaxID=1399 RepID=UPI0030028C95